MKRMLKRNSVASWLLVVVLLFTMAFPITRTPQYARAQSVNDPDLIQLQDFQIQLEQLRQQYALILARDRHISE